MSQTYSKASPGLASDIQKRLTQFQDNLNRIILGKASVVERLLIALLAQGHVLLEDVPGTGKTTLAKSFALGLNCDFRRVQFTPDLLPSDVIGASIYSPSEQCFHFQKGPLFTHILMADEINRASPRTQSALLEAMAENQVTIEGTTYPLSQPFLVLATQNPMEYQGTYPLPEAQLDRFMMRLELGYPELEQEFEMLFAQSNDAVRMEKHLSPEDIQAFQAVLPQVHVSEDLARYILNLVKASREHPDIQLGISPRGSLALFQSLRVRALLQERLYVIPEDLHFLAESVLAHRLMLNAQVGLEGSHKTHYIRELLQAIPAP